VALNATANAILITDVDGQIEWANPAFSQLSGYALSEVIGRNPRDLVRSGQHNQSYYQSLWKTILSKQTWRGEIINRRKDGSFYDEDMTITPMLDQAGEITHFVAIKQDISERKEAEAIIRNLAFYDTLTLLPNRRLLNERLTQALLASKRNQRYGALMFLDLDNFKPLNDLHGHSVGDLLLIEVARRIKGCLREVDTVARFGGDEFVVLLTELDEDRAESGRQAESIAEKIRQTLAAPYILTHAEEDGTSHTVEHRCTSSIGVALFTGQDARADDIMKWADAAMYQAKDAGRNQICFYLARSS